MPEWNISEKSMLDGVKHVYVFQREYATVIPALVQVFPSFISNPFRELFAFLSLNMNPKP